mmetsp:Transcript_54559/g.127553  ORF Transcript_54559/g.127553 Transcript_54559/m.127553 type:complete len:585 (+) Transcript_54559:97-1851(+)
MLRDGWRRSAGAVRLLTSEVPLHEEPLKFFHRLRSSVATILQTATKAAPLQVIEEAPIEPIESAPQKVVGACSPPEFQLTTGGRNAFKLSFQSTKAPGDCLKDALAVERRQEAEQAFEYGLQRGSAVVKKKQELLQKHRDILGRGLVQSEFDELHHGWKELISLDTECKMQKSRCDKSSSAWTVNLMQSYVKTYDSSNWSSHDGGEISWAKCFQEFLQDVQPRQKDAEILEQKRASLLEALPGEDFTDDWVLGLAQRIDDALTSMGIEPAAVPAQEAAAAKAQTKAFPPHGCLQARSEPHEAQPGVRVLTHEEALGLLGVDGFGSPSKLKKLMGGISVDEEVWFPDSLDKATRQKFHKLIGALKSMWLLETWRGVGKDRLVMWHKSGSRRADEKAASSQPVWDARFLRLQGLAHQELTEAASRSIVDILLLELARRVNIVVTLEALLQSPEFPSSRCDYVLQPPLGSPFRGYKLGAVEVKRCKSTSWVANLSQAVMQNCLQLMTIQLQNSELCKADTSTTARRIPKLPLIGVATDGRRWVCTKLEHDGLHVSQAIDLTSADQLMSLLANLVDVLMGQQAQLNPR